MDEVFIKIKNTLLEDLKDTDFISIEELFSLAEDLKCERDAWKEKYEDEIEQREEFYKPKNPYEVYGLNESDFI